MKGLTAHELAVMLTALAALVGLARLLGEIARHYRQPAVLGEILAGILLGPTVLGALWPQGQLWLFPGEGPNAIALDAIGSLSIVLFLLVAGIEVDLATVWKQGQSALKVGLLGTVVPFVVGLIAAYAIPQQLGSEAQADSFLFALFFATAMSISALPVIAKTLMDLNLYRTDLGMVVVSAAILNDIVGWTVFAMIIGMIGGDEGPQSIGLTVLLTFVFIGSMLTVGRWLIHRTLPALQAYSHWPGGVLGFAVSLCLISAAVTDLIGIHAIFGAFIAGVALGGSSHMQERTRVMLEEIVSFIFAPIFFASIGLRVDFVQNFDLPMVLWVLGIACVTKLVGATWGARWGGFGRRESLAIGSAMNARGAMEIILGLLALNAGVITPKLFVALVVMAIATSASGGPLIRWALQQQRPFRLANLLSPKLFSKELRSTNRRDAIRELAELAASQVPVTAVQVEQIAWRRELVAATGIGSGVAIPHARVKDLAGPLVVVGLSPAGIEFDAPDGQPAHVIFLLITPHDDPAIQLQMSAAIAAVFRRDGATEKALRAGSYTEFVAVIKTLTPIDRGHAAPPAGTG